MKRILITIITTSTIFAANAQQGQVEKALEDKYMKEHGNAGLSKLQDFMDNMNSAVTRPVYSFPLAVKMHVTTYDKGAKKNETDMKYHVNVVDETVGFSGAEMKGGNKNLFTVYDSKNNSMVMLDDKHKNYTAMNMNAFMSAEAQAKRGKQVAGNTKCNSTGNSKTIRGYDCKEFVCIDPDKETRVEVWVTDKIPVHLSSAAKGQPWSVYYAGMWDMKGMLIEGKMYEKGQLEGTMEVTEIDEKTTKTVTLSNYEKNEMFGR